MCVLNSSNGNYNFNFLGELIYTDRELGFFTFSPCSNVKIGGPNCPQTPAMQNTFSECISLGTLKSRTVKPLLGILGISISFSGGSNGRSAVIELECFEGPNKIHFMADGPTQLYRMRVQSRAGCPLSCTRNSLSGAVCGGNARGICKMADDNSSASCFCFSGYFGNQCREKRAHKIFDNTFVSPPRFFYFLITGFFIYIFFEKRGAGVIMMNANSCRVYICVFFTLLFVVVFYGRNSFYAILSPSTPLYPSYVAPSKYLISTQIAYGRASNNELSLLDLLGAAFVSSRSLVVPELTNCVTNGHGADFSALFDDSTPLVRHIRSLNSFDSSVACNGSFVIIEPGPYRYFGQTVSASFGGLSMSSLQLTDIRLSNDLMSGGFRTIADQVNGPIHTKFLPATRHTVFEYRTDAFFFEKIASRPERCVVLGQNFLSSNWERHPLVFLRAVRSLVPAPPIYIAALDFLGRHGLAGGNIGCPLGQPKAVDEMKLADAFELLRASPDHRWREDTHNGLSFLGIHLRMTDFLAFESSGMACNINPSLLVDRVRVLLSLKQHITRIVVASDDFGSACYRGLATAFGEDPIASAQATAAALASGNLAAAAVHQVAMRSGGIVFPTSGGSDYVCITCHAVLFDQEVLGHAAYFLGDDQSTFSEAVHRIRTLRCGAAQDSSEWLPVNAV